MDKCRICLKVRKKIRSLYDAINGITFLDMITSFANIKVDSNNDILNNICSSCTKKLQEAYEFKIIIERSEMILNENASLKRINFNNISDIKIEIGSDCNSLITSVGNCSMELFKDGDNIITYNDTVIKRIKEETDYTKKTLIDVKEFLNSVKMESDDCDNQDYELAIEYDPASDSDYNIEKQPKQRKKTVKKESKGSKAVSGPYTLMKPIIPVYLEDIRMARTAAQGIRRKPRRRKLNKDKNELDQTTICPYCGKLLLTRYLNTHILFHTGEKIFKCDQCPKTFFRESSLKHHRRIHTDDKKFKCDLCIATFAYKEALKSHLGSHSNEKKYVCEICKKAFKKKGQLNRHLLIHSFASKPVQCELCSMSFYNKSCLKAHMRVHTGERPFKCEICSQPYSYKPDFNRHCLKKHGIFLKGRSVYIMNEEVLQRERALMKDLQLHAHGVIKGDDIMRTFDGARGAIAYEQAMKAVEAGQIPINGPMICHKTVSGKLKSTF